MKPYGMKRVPEIEWPDKADIRALGLKSKHGGLPPKSKALTRRLQKRHARRQGKVACGEVLDA